MLIKSVPPGVVADGFRGTSGLASGGRMRRGEKGVRGGIVSHMEFGVCGCARVCV